MTYSVPVAVCDKSYKSLLPTGVMAELEEEITLSLAIFLTRVFPRMTFDLLLVMKPSVTLLAKLFRMTESWISIDSIPSRKIVPCSKARLPSIIE